MTPLPALTGLRFAAAAAVALSHLWYVAEHPALPAAVRRLIAEGPAGVSFFFVLSGFVLAVNYRDRFPALTRGRLLPYYAARVGRIWPSHLVVLALAVAFPYLPADGPFDPAKLLAHAFLVQGWVPDLRFAASYNAVAWTLSAEAFFYLVLPGMLFLAGRYPGTSPKRLLILAAGVWLVGLGLARRTDPFGMWLMGLCPAGRLFEFAVGVLTGLAFARRASSPAPFFRSPPPLGGRVRVGGDGPPLPGMPSPQRQAATPHPNPPPQGGRGPEKQGGGWELAAVGGLLVLAAVADRVPPLVRANGYYTPMMAAVVWAFAAGGGRLSKLFASRPAVALGEISFAFYLLHCLVFFHAHRLVGVEPLTPAGLAVGSVLAALLLSAGLHRGVETPARGWVVRAAARTQAARPVSGRGLPFGRHVWGVR